MPEASVGVIVPGRDLMRCPGLMYADDVVVLSDSVEGAQRGIKGVYEWGQRFGMELGLNKCGVLLWKGGPVAPRKRCQVLDFEEDNETHIDREELELAHKATTYGTPEGPIPMVDDYKYLGITVDRRLGDPRKVVVGEQSMELDCHDHTSDWTVKNFHFSSSSFFSMFIPFMCSLWSESTHIR